MRPCARAWTGSPHAMSSTALSRALAQENAACVNPIDALRALRDGLEQHPSLSRERRDELLNLIAEARREYDEIAKKEVQKRFRLLLRGVGPHAAEQLSRQRRSLLQQQQDARPDHG